MTRYLLRRITRAIDLARIIVRYVTGHTSFAVKVSSFESNEQIYKKRYKIKLELIRRKTRVLEFQWYMARR